ncbi:MAG: ATP-binding cassette domain-containing protein [Nitrospirae bacterium]|nr:ATP-binding cassette domain-containing protein [Candidatus Manganitrophaceae bacterium]
MIKIDHLIKEFDGGVRAVDDISLHVQAGEVFGFLGPNGAGKTTTIKILTTLLHPTSGTVRIAGHDVSQDPLAVRMSFGYVGQQSGVDPAFTVSENMLLQGRLYHLPKKKIEERMEALLSLFDMSERSGQWVGSLSGGLKRRLDIATALIHEPKLLFLDEPTIGLDPKSRADLWAYLRRLNQEGMTLFLTTHHLDEVDQLANRVGILDSGRIRVIGTPDELKDSLGEDTIHLTFDRAVDTAMLEVFRKKEWFKEVIQEGLSLRLYLENGQTYLPKVMQWLEALGLTAKSVLLARPTFDDVYLKYTGKNWLLAGESSEDEWGGKNNKWAKKWKKSDDSDTGGDEEWKKWGDQAQGSWSEEKDTPEKLESNPAEVASEAASESNQSDASGTGQEEPWKKWGDQAQGDWSAEKKSVEKSKVTPSEEVPESTQPDETKKTVESNDAENVPDEPWKKWQGQGDANWSSEDKSSEDKPKGESDASSQWPSDESSDKNWKE